MARTGRKRRTEGGAELGRELWGIACLAVCGLSLLSLYSTHGGVVGDLFGRVLRLGLGEAAVLAVAGLGCLGVLLLTRLWPAALGSRLLGLVALVLLAASVIHSPYPPGREFEAGLRGLGGGVAGAAISWGLSRAFGDVGRHIVLAAGVAIALVLLLNVPFTDLVAWLHVGLRWTGRSLLAALRSLRDWSCPERSEEGDGAGTRPVRDRSGEPSPTVHAPVEIPGPSAGRVPGAPSAPDDGPARPEPVASGPAVTSGPAVDDGAPPRMADREAGKAAYSQPPLDERMLYEPPPLSLLRPQTGAPQSGGGQRQAAEKAAQLEETLQSFGVQARVTAVTQGPVITRFELQPAPGVKVSRIMSLASDIALSLAAPDVRIEAPIPGKAVMGVEVPNREVSVVCLREVCESPEFQRSAEPLTVALGKDIAGRPVVAGLHRMLHLLIAGATGSGKSVCLNGLITSLLLKYHPDDVKLLLIDPKVVEFNSLNGVPHLLAPVVTNPKRAAAALRWVVREMERRYALLAAAGVKDIGKYNELCRRGSGPQGSDGPFPYIVVIIDELADLMMVAPVDVEDAIHRLAQMARASGIHLVVATQRPSVDVITGVIKANIPSRIAFSVSSQIDSRTILDVNGAEKLVGRGDMLFLPAGSFKPTRVQGAFVSEQEMERVVEFLRRQGRPRYADMPLPEVGDEGAAEDESEADPLLPDAVREVLEHGQASVSMLQRRLRVGYTRAGRLVDEMEKRGFVGPYEGTKPRELRLSWEEYRRLFQGGGQEDDEESAATAERDDR